MTDAFPLVAAPLFEESAVSWVERSAEAMGVTMHRLTAMIAQGRVVDRWTDDQWATAAGFSGRPLADITHLRRRTAATPRGESALLGVRIRTSFLVQGAQRICPACVGENGCLAAVWDIGHVVACSRHGVRLVDACRCGLLLRERARGKAPRTCVCELPYADNTTNAASPAALTATKWIEAAIARENGDAHDDGPNGCPLAELSTGDLVLALELIGRAALSTDENDVQIAMRHPHFDRGGLPLAVRVADSIRTVEAAVDLLSEWPSSYQRLLDRVAARCVPERGKFVTRGLATRMFATAVGRSLVRPWIGMDGLPLKPLALAMDEWCLQKFSSRRKVERAPAVRRWDVPERRRRVASLLGETFNGRFSRYLRRALHHIRSDNDDEIERQLLERLSESYGRGTPTIDLRQALEILEGVNRPSYAAWIHPGLLTPVAGDPDGPRHSLRFDAEQVRGLAARLSAVAGPADEADPVGWTPTSAPTRLQLRSWYNKTDMLLDILAGKVRVAAARTNAPYTELLIELASLRRREMIEKTKMLLRNDRAYTRHHLIPLLRDLWPDHAPIPLDRSSRLSGTIEFVEFVNKSENRDRPGYRFRLSSVLRAQLAATGPSAFPEIDDLLK